MVAIRKNPEIMHKFNSIKEFLMYEPIFSIPNLVWLFFAFDILTRFFWIGRESIWLDEAISIVHASEIPSTGNLFDIYLFGNSWNTDHPLFYYLLLHEYINFLGIYKAVPDETALRSLSAILGIIIFPIIYYAGKLIDKSVGILASLLMLVNTCNLYYSQMGRMYTMTSLLVLLSSYFFYILLTRKKDASYRQYIYYILISTILIYTDYVGFLVLGFQFLYGIVYYWISKDKFRLRRLLISISSIFLLYLPWLPVFYRKLSEGGTSWMIAPSIDQGLKALISVIGIQLGSSYPSSIIIRLIFTILVLFLIIGMVSSFKDRINFNTLMAAICIIPLVMFFISSFTSVHIFSDRQISAFSPEFDLVLATGLIRSYSLFPESKPRILSGFVIATILCSIILMIGYMHSYYVTDTYEDWRDATEYVKDNIQSNNIILFDDSSVRKPFAFYFNLKKVEALYINRDLKSIELPIDPLKYKTIWVILSHTDHNEQMYSKWLNSIGVKYGVSRQNFRKIEILQFKITGENGIFQLSNIKPSKSYERALTLNDL